MTVVTRGDIRPGQVAVQSIHAAVKFQYEHPVSANHWYDTSEIVALLAVETLHDLKRFKSKLDELGVPNSMFIEPDMGHEPTAIAFIQNEQTKKLTKNLPLALSERSEVCV